MTEHGEHVTACARPSPCAPVDVDVLMVNYNTGNLMPQALSALAAGAGSLRYRTLVVDNASPDRSGEKLASRQDIDLLVLNERNVGFGRANNQLLSHLQASFVLLLNTDAFMRAGALEAAVGYMREHPRCGIVGGRLEGLDGDLQPSCRYFPSPWGLFVKRMGIENQFPSTRLVDQMDWAHLDVRSCDWVPGCFYLVRRQVLDTVGLFDERFFLYYEEVDHCRRVKTAGWDVMFLPTARVVHVGGESAKSSGVLDERSRQLSAYQVESELLYFRKYLGLGGLMRHLVLVAIGVAVQVLKDMARRRPLRVVRASATEIALTSRLCMRTRMGLLPTR